MNPFGHMNLPVADLAAAESFYDALLPALGLTERYHGATWKVWATNEPLPGGLFRGHDLSDPKEMPYGPGYYAVLFADRSGNRLEVYVGPAEES